METNVCVNETGICYPIIQDAINNATSGQTVVIVNDLAQYNENVVVNVTGLTLTSNTSTRPVIWSNSSQAPINVTAGNATVRNIHAVYNGTGSQIGAIHSKDVSAYNLTVSNNTLNNTSNGTYAGGVVFWYSGYQSAISQNIIGTSTSAYGPGIVLISPTYTTISNNSIWTDGTSDNYGIYTSAGGNLTIDGNVVWSGGTSTQNIGMSLSSSTTNATMTNNRISTYGNGAGSQYGILISGNGHNMSENTISTYSTSGSGNMGIFFNVVTYSTANRNNISSGGVGSSNIGIYLPSGSNGNNLTGNKISTSGTSGNFGVYLISSSLNGVAQNSISTGGTTSSTGIYLSASSSNTVSSNVVYTVNATSASSGIEIGSSSSSNMLRSNNVTTNSTSSYGVQIETSNNNTFYDSNISAPAAYDVFLVGTTAGNNNYFVNVSFNESDIGTNGATVATKLFVQHRLDVTARNSSGPLNGAIVFGNDTNSVDNVENPASNFSAATNSTGQIPTQLLSEFMANGTHNSTSGYLYFNNYTVTASKAGHVDNSTAVYMTDDLSVDILLRAMIYATTIFGRSSESFQLATDTELGSVYAMVNSVNASRSLNSGWSHVAMTFDSGTIKLYVNGQLAGTASTSVTPAAGNRSLMLGNGTDLVIDEVAFRSGVLSQSAIEQHYQVGPGLKAIVSAVGGGSFGRNFNISASTSDGSFSNRHITAADLLAGTTQSVNLPNATGVPTAVVVTSNSCNQVLTATKAQLSGVYC
ncbi:MAG: right-handed parallel beta-helix repeat-containing protein [Candidatus Aenigmarchaeota archaeon]|nr:right-handed parallel beta-helix repeat-containing protein [Candidatus Aenigmarchaeota archaeon]